MLFFVDKGQAANLIPQNNAAIVSVVIGPAFRSAWEVLSRKSWEYYAYVNGFDIIIITDFLDVSDKSLNRSPAWQKLLILNQPWTAAYKRIIYLDADISISPFALNILDYATDETKIGISLSNDRLSAAEKQIYLERAHKITIRPDLVERGWLWHQQNIFDLYGIISETGTMYNTGVLVLSPVHHAGFFRDIYQKEEKGRLYEQPSFSLELEMRGMAQLISPRFNWGVLETIFLYMPEKFGKPLSAFGEKDLALLEMLFQKEFINSYFLHFYGCLGLVTEMQNSFGPWIEAQWYQAALNNGQSRASA